MLDIHTHTRTHTVTLPIAQGAELSQDRGITCLLPHTHTHTHTRTDYTHSHTHTVTLHITHTHTHTLHITQGAELSQDRGRMQAETESLRAQHKEAQLQLTSDKDALRIKECQVTGELESINYV